MIRRAAVLGAAALASGCASMQFDSQGARDAEIAWQALQLADTAQTVTIARSPGCLWESDPFAVAVYGSKHPSVPRVIVTNTAMAAIHWAVGSWIDRQAQYAIEHDSGSAGLWYVARGGFYVLSIAGSGAAVVGNVRLGVRPLSHAHCTADAR